MHIVIRPAGERDAAGIARVRVLTWQATYTGIVPQDYLDRLDIEQQTLKWREGLANSPPERHAFVAEDSETGEVAGYCMCGPNRDADPEYPAEIYALYVLPAHQRQGIGQALVKAAADCLSACGYGQMVIFVLRENTPSRQFYEAMGGKLAREKLVEIGGIMLQEVGYGYRLTR